MSRRRGAAQRGYSEREEQKKYRRGKKTGAGGEKGGPRERGGTAGGVSSGIWILKLLKQRRVGRTAARAAGRRRTAGAPACGPLPRRSGKNAGHEKRATRPSRIALPRLVPRRAASCGDAPALPEHPPRPARSSPRARSVRPGLPPPEAEGNLFLPPAPSLPTARRPLPAFPTAPCLPTPRSRRPHIPPSCSMSASTPTAWLQFSPEGIRTRAARYTVERCW